MSDHLDLIGEMIDSPTEESIEVVLDNDEIVFWVDWREQDEDVVEYCEDILQTGSLACEGGEINKEPGFAMFVTYQGQRVNAGLIGGCEDRHLTVVAMNKVLKPEYEIRFCIDSNGSDTLAFLPLPTSDWKSLEKKFGKAEVEARFYKLKMSPNVFTDPLPF